MAFSYHDNGDTAATIVFDMTWAARHPGCRLANQNVRDAWREKPEEWEWPLCLQALKLTLSDRASNWGISGIAFEISIYM